MGKTKNGSIVAILFDDLNPPFDSIRQEE